MTSRLVECRIETDTNFDETEVVETDRLLSARGSLRLAPPNQSITGTSGMIAQATFELDNSDDRFSSLITTGAIYSEISGGQMYRLPVAIDVRVDSGSWERIFTGVAKIPKNRTLAPGQPKTIQFDCRGNEERILNIRTNTEQADFVTNHDSGLNEAEYMYDLLVNVIGLTAPELDLDTGTTVIPWFWADESSPIEACWRLSAAAGGHFYCNRDGLFTFRNNQSWLTATRSTTVQRTFTRADFENLSVYYDDNDLSSKVNATASLYEIGESGALWSAREPLTVGAGETITITATFNNPAYTIESVDYVARSAGGTDLSASITLTQTQYAQRVTLEFENTHATLAAIISALSITGQAVELAERILVDKVSADTFWTGGNPNRSPNTLPQRINNPYVQTRAQADSLAGFVLGRQERPQLMAVISGTQGDPELEIGDLIEISDAELMSSSREFIIIGIDFSYSAAGGFRQDILAVDKAGLYPYDEYFILGTGGSLLGGTDVLFY